MPQSKGYADPPWTFKGRALYQLALVPEKVAREFVPKELPLVAAFGYTLGGLYLARYEESPAGAFDEAVALAGLVWAPPASAAWAARVYVSNAAAERHGVTSCGLPSRLAAFEAPAKGWWGFRRRQRKAKSDADESSRVELSARAAGPAGPLGTVCDVTVPEARKAGWTGPRVRLALPSFSGRTDAEPRLLKYALDLRANVRPCAPAAVSAERQTQLDGGAALRAVLEAKPVLTLAFDDLHMEVGEPRAVKDHRS